MMRTIRKHKGKATHLSSHQHSSDYAVVFTFIFAGSLILTLVLALLLSVSYFIGQNTYVGGRLLLCGFALAYLGGMYFSWRKGLVFFAALGLIIFYGVLATLILILWGINTPFGILLLATTIILASILLGPRWALYVAASMILTLIGIQLAISYGGYIPQFSASIRASRMGDVVAYSTILSVLALISWLFGRQTERLLFRNRQGELALLKEKELLEIRVEQRTKQLRQAQLDEMQQLYQFVEIGQLSSVLLHDLANHLSVLTFDISDLKKQQHSEAIARAQSSISYLEGMVHQVRDQLHGATNIREFDVLSLVKENVQLLTHKIRMANVIVTVKEPAKKTTIYGDPLRFSHVITILLNNSIEAYGKSGKGKREVIVQVYERANEVFVRIQNWGSAIPTLERKQLFKPRESSKKTGLGIGLFIAHQIVKTHFRGVLTLAHTSTPTEFIVKIPK